MTCDWIQLGDQNRDNGPYTQQPLRSEKILCIQNWILRSIPNDLDNIPLKMDYYWLATIHAQQCYASQHHSQGLCWVFELATGNHLSKNLSRIQK